jgi:hypothetical protein
MLIRRMQAAALGGAVLLFTGYAVANKKENNK